MVKRRIWLGGLALACLVGAAAARGEVKMAVVDMNRLITTHPDLKAKLKALELQVDEFRAERAKLTQERDDREAAAKDAWKAARSKALSESAKEERQRELEEKVIELEQIKREIQRNDARRKLQLADEKMRIQGELLEKINVVVAGYAKQKGFDLVLDVSSVGVGGVGTLVYAADRIDITEAILKLTGGDKTEAAAEALPGGGDEPGDEDGDE